MRAFLNKILTSEHVVSPFYNLLGICLLQLVSIYFISGIITNLSDVKPLVKQETRNVSNENQVINSRPVGIKRALVVYAYFEKNKVYQQTLSYFLDIGVQESDSIDYLFIIQDFNVSVPLPTHYKNVKVLKRNNTCYDFGAYGIGIEYMGGIDEIGYKYEYFIFMNPSAFGPILPKYWPENIHWTEIFFSRFSDLIHGVGAIISCSEKGPYMDGWLITVDYAALVEAHKAGALNCHQSKSDVVVKGEFEFSSSILRAGYNLDSLMSKYPSGYDWRDIKNWRCFHKPLWKLGYSNDKEDFHFNVHPLEIVFFKSAWYEHTVGRGPYDHTKLLESVYYNETLTYMSWALKRKLQSQLN